MGKCQLKDKHPERGIPGRTLKKTRVDGKESCEETVVPDDKTDKWGAVPEKHK